MTPVDENVKPKKTAMTPEQRRQRQFLLNQLVYEMEDEKPVYYAGYWDVLNGIKEPRNNGREWVTKLFGRNCSAVPVLSSVQHASTHHGQ